MKYFGFDVSSFIPCEVCGGQCTEIHHLTPRSLRKDLVNKIDNLMALCRTCHERAHNDRQFNDDLRLIHRRKCLQNGLPDNEREIYYDHRTNGLLSK